MTIGFGIDIGGSGIKGAPVDLSTGQLAEERYRVATPQPSTPDAVAETVAEVVEHFGWKGTVGVTFPAVVTGGVARTAANVDKSWIGTDITKVVGNATGLSVVALNDADAAGLAEVAFGAAAGQSGLVIVITLGTGIGSALIYDGVLVPNSEIGHLEVDGKDAETVTSAAAREREDLSWHKWAKRLDRYFRAVEAYLWPDLIVVGGGVSRRADKYLPLLHVRTPVVPAKLQNEAGIVGASLAAAGAGTRWTSVTAGVVGAGQRKAGTDGEVTGVVAKASAPEDAAAK
ncbi:MAG TPA: ROK family protein [Acidimicrobiales bacterium]|nr:ROK family protein [Acidimicrobiales bacterium]